MRLLLFALLIVLVSCQESIEGSGNVIDEERTLGAVDAVDASGAVTVFVRQGASQRVTVRADDNIIGRLRTEVRQGVLQIYMKSGNYRRTTTEVTVELPTLRAVSVGGAVSAEVSGFEDLNALDVSASGSSNVAASGSARTLSLDISGASHFRGSNFTADACRVNASGASGIEITCVDLLEGSLSGSSILTYRGRPDLDVSTSGVSSVNSGN